MTNVVQILMSKCDSTLSALRGIDLNRAWMPITGEPVAREVMPLLRELISTATQIDVADAPPDPPSIADFSVGGMSTQLAVPMAIRYVQRLRRWCESLLPTSQLSEAKTRDTEPAGDPIAVSLATRDTPPVDVLGHQKGPRHACRSRQESRQPGRPPGGRTAVEDLKLFDDWKAAQRATGITKAEFLKERGLSKDYLRAMECGRARAKRRSGQK
jgi:hypothetical protein